MSIITFPFKYEAATVPLQFDFLSQLESGETISSHGCTALTEVGDDANPSALLSGATSVSNVTVTQMITGGEIGVIYRVTCSITTSLGRELSMYGRVAVVSDYPFQE